MHDGTGNEVFTASSFSNGSTGITVNGTASQFVVINFNNGTNNFNLGGPITLTGGITSDHVLFNFFGTGGTLGGSANGATVNGIFLAPNMKINIDAVNLQGRLIGGGSSTSNNDFQIVSNAFVTQPAPGAIPEPASLAIWGLGALGCAVAGYRRRRPA
jgi:hypothetical protein